MSQPDILFIVLDTQRADRLGCYGYHKPTSPNLDTFAQQSTLFEQAIAPAQWTIPSHASMFTGLYPTAHQVLQSNQTLGADRPHLVELLQGAGYQTVGFCNNPLVGILDNGFKRGFQTFYNYGGAFPSLPESSSYLPYPLSMLAEKYTQFLRRISYPIQNFFGQSELAFSISLNAWLTPLWSKLAHFKGQNERSVQDVCHFLRHQEQQKGDAPLFLFLNLMETHLPFTPKPAFVDKMVPYMRGNPEAQATMQAWNREAYRWAAPLAEPLGELENRLLSDMYDAEVSYQDDYLAQLFAVLEERANRENTLTLIVADHGDGLGEHGLIGHTFVAYQELVHVPLIMNWARHVPASTRVSTPVSTRRVYHTLLDAAGVLPEVPHLDAVEIHNLTLKHTILGQDPEQGVAFTEVYPPLNFVRAVADRYPDLIEPFRCRSVRRAVVHENWKLIHVNDMADELLDLERDPLELENQMVKMPALTAQLNQTLSRIAHRVEAQRETITAGDTYMIEDEALLQRLRALGYME